MTESSSPDQPRAPANSKPVSARHRFQSFWAGGPLSPYEVLCQKSFIDRGHAFDLYTFEPDVGAPPGVRICDAAELFEPKELFVYEDGVGKGSPAAFSNLFRYKLLAEKGGWWVDTDVLCLADDIPSFGAFFAREDAHVVNTAVLFFEPRHPLMIRCFEEAMRMGRSIRWGDAGPYLLTRVVKELGCTDGMIATELCYPLHYSEALDILRPSRTDALRERAAWAFFVHFYSAMLQLKRIQKTRFPPKGSMLRHWVERHPVDGWEGAYNAKTIEQLLATPISAA